MIINEKKPIGVTLEKMKYVVSQRISKEIIDKLSTAPEIEFSLHCYWMADDIVARAVGFVYTEKIDEVSIRYPADWWQAFKERWFPKCLLKKCPVGYTIEKLEARVLYPRVSFPGEVHTIQVFVK